MNDELNIETDAGDLNGDSLKQNGELFQVVFETNPDPIVISRVKDSVIADVNPAFTVHTGYRREEVVGRSVIGLQIWKDPERRAEFIERVLKNGYAKNQQAVFRAKSGVSLTCLVNSRIIEIGGKIHLLSVIRDITDLHLYEKKVHGANAFLHIANRHRQIQPLLTDFVQEIRKMTRCLAAAVRIMDQETGLIPYVAAEGFSSDFCRLEGELSINARKGTCVWVIKGEPGPLMPLFTRNGSFFVRSTTEFLATATEEQKSLMRNTCHRHGFETIALIPIRFGSSTIGLIHVADPEPDMIDSDVVEILENAALQLSTALQRVLAEQALREAHDELEERVKKRTQMLTDANRQMQEEIEERKRVERKLEDHQTRLRRLATQLLQTQELERRGIAAEIHDRIGQTLAVTKMMLGALKTTLGSDQQLEMLEEIRELIARTIDDTRTLTFELSPPVLYELGLQAALEWLAESVPRQAGLSVAVERQEGIPKLEVGRRVFLYQAVRELLFNVVKHAGAKKARIRIGGDPSCVRVDVIDDGKGTDPHVEKASEKDANSGFGLFSIREQIQYYGGRLEIDRALEGGTRATIIMPTDWQS